MHLSYLVVIPLFVCMFIKLIYCRAQDGEGNGNPLQYSCLDNPMGGGAWWAAVHGVADRKSTRLNSSHTAESQPSSADNTRLSRYLKEVHLISNLTSVTLILASHLTTLNLILKIEITIKLLLLLSHFSRVRLCATP